MAVLVPVADGTEEAEAVVTVDILRRAALEVVVAGLTTPVTCSRLIRLIPETTLETLSPEQQFDAIVLPGGAEGTKQLMGSERLREMLRAHSQRQQWVAAICAAPLVLHVTHILTPGQMVTGHPTIRQHLVESYVFLNKPVVVDGKVVTSQGMGTALDFALTLVALLRSPASAEQIAERICYPWKFRG